MYSAKIVKLTSLISDSIVSTENKRKSVINTGSGTPFSGIVPATIGDIFYDLSGSIAYWWNGTNWLNFNRFTDEVRIGTTAQRPANPSVGLVWLDTTTEIPVWYMGPAAGWKTFTGEVTTSGSSYNLKTDLTAYKLLLWFDFSDTSTVLLGGNVVSKILDKSGYNNHTTNMGTLYPYHRRYHNGLSMLMGETTNSGFFGSITGATANSSAYTIFLVHSCPRSVPNDWTYSLLELRETTTTNYIGFLTSAPFSTNALRGVFSKVTSDKAEYATNPSSSIWATPCLTTFTMSATTMEIFFNGTSRQSRTGLTVPAFTLATYFINGNNMCNYGELIVVNNTLNATYRQRVEGYLAHKWGIAGKLPSDHTFKNSPPS
jgi:hypothetical protein